MWGRRQTQPKPVPVQPVKKSQPKPKPQPKDKHLKVLIKNQEGKYEVRRAKVPQTYLIHLYSLSLYLVKFVLVKKTKGHVVLHPHNIQLKYVDEEGDHVCVEDKEDFELFQEITRDEKIIKIVIDELVDAQENSWKEWTKGEMEMLHDSIYNYKYESNENREFFIAKTVAERTAGSVLAGRSIEEIEWICRCNPDVFANPPQRPQPKAQVHQAPQHQTRPAIPQQAPQHQYAPRPMTSSGMLPRPYNPQQAPQPQHSMAGSQYGAPQPSYQPKPSTSSMMYPGQQQPSVVPQPSSSQYGAPQPQSSLHSSAYNQTAPFPYDNQLVQLRNMGFTDDVRSKSALLQHKGAVHLAIQDLVRNQ